jgi:para-aminobenzoate synthetase component I
MFISQLPYHPDGAALFSRFASHPYAVFIDSCGLDRFDIIAADPIEVITADAQADAFSLAKQLLTRHAAITDHAIPQDLPFSTGVIGYFCYDLGGTLEQLPLHAARDITLPAAIIGFYNWSIILDHQERVTYVISQNPPKQPALAAVLTLISQPAPPPSHFSLTGNFSSNLTKSQYAAAFNRIKQHLHDGDCYQINLAQRFSAPYQGSPWAAYQKLRRQNPMPMAAFMNLPERAILCLSPERFLSVTESQVITQPIKGTSPRFSDPIQDQCSARTLLASVKDRAENIMIVDLLRNDLSKSCLPGSVKVPKLCALESFTNVHHLVSTVTGQLAQDQHPFDLLRNCFPGGSITGAPKRRAMEIIDQLEPNHRSLYCGSIAYCDVRGRMDSNITIRTLLCDNHKIHCYGGGGIVYDSTMESEYREIQFKISRLLNTLQPFIPDSYPEARG